MLKIGQSSQYIRSTTAGIYVKDEMKFIFSKDLQYYITNDEKGMITIFTDIHKVAILLHNDTNALKEGKKNLMNN